MDGRTECARTQSKMWSECGERLGTHHAIRLMDRPPLKITLPSAGLRLMARQTAAGGKMERNSQDKGRGEGALHLSKMASVAMQLGTKAIYTPALLSPPPPTHTNTTNTTPFFFFLPRLHCHCGGLLDLRHCFGMHERREGGGSLYPC